MPGNTDPIYSRRGQISRDAATGMNQLVTAQASDYTGIDADTSLIFTADATNGSFIQRIRLKAGGTNIATVARFYINNGSTPATATNNTFYGEVSLPATTANPAAATVEIDYPMGFAINPAYRIYMGLATAVSAGWVATVIAGDY